MHYSAQWRPPQGESPACVWPGLTVPLYCIQTTGSAHPGRLQQGSAAQREGGVAPPPGVCVCLWLFPGDRCCDTKCGEGRGG